MAPFTPERTCEAPEHAHASEFLFIFLPFCSQILSRRRSLSSQYNKASGVDSIRTSTSDDAADQGPVTVDIRGQRLTIRSDRNRDFVIELARYFDDKVAELQAAAPTATFDKLLILAGMNVAGELFEARNQLAQLQEEIRQRSEVLHHLLETYEQS